MARLESQLLLLFLPPPRASRVRATSRPARVVLSGFRSCLCGVCDRSHARAGDGDLSHPLSMCVSAAITRRSSLSAPCAPVRSPRPRRFVHRQVDRDTRSVLV
jgi:hypothetical protein